MKLKRLLSVLTLAVMVCTAFAGCGKKEETGGGEELPSKINEIALTVDKVVDMPDWTGKKLDLVYWFCQGTNAPTIGQYAKDRTIRNELARISGITLNEEFSVDNAGESGDAKIAKIMATDTWPDVGYNIEESLIKRFAEVDKVWDLTEMIPKYMPNYMKVVNYNERSQKQFEAKKIDGKYYVVNKPSSYGVAKATDPEYSPEKYSSVISPENTRTTIWVRDDILTQIYPEAKTRAGLEQTYLDKGEFTKEEMTDVTITSMEQFGEFLRKINELGIKENGRKIYPIYTHNGSDNWDVLTTLTSALNGGIASSATNYFAYFDKSQGKLVRTIDQPWFKESMKFWVDLINSDISSREALVDNKAAFEQKKNNGEYAVLYGSITPPTAAALKAAGKNYAYRQVIIDIAPNYDRFIKSNTSENYVAGERFILFKTDNLKTEQDVEQVLRFIDFLYTPIGSKAMFWGPETSGLYTEDENGVLKFTDAKLEEDWLFGGQNKMKVHYGVTSFPDLENFGSYGTLYYPKTVYGKSDVRKASQYSGKFKYSFIEPAPGYPDLVTDQAIYNWVTDVEELGKFWDARVSSEDAFTVVFTASNDAEFEQYYKELVDTVTRNGLDETTMEKWNKVYKEKNAEYWDEYINWKPNN